MYILLYGNFSINHKNNFNLNIYNITKNIRATLYMISGNV